uniref:Uncharacterized protein n=2 Tax=Caenorhabditis japonica TaxID=281687 RepID=A0A8R1IXA2_CAEJA
MITVYANRYFLLTPVKSKRWKRFKTPVYVLNYLWVCIHMIPFIFMIPEQKEAVEFILQKVPCFPYYAGDTPMFVFALDPFPITANVVAVFSIQVTIMVILVVLTIVALYNHAHELSTSRHTLSLHKKFLAAMLIQTGLPVVVLMIPLLYMAYTIPTGYHNQGKGQACGVLGFPSAASHDTLSA